MLCCSKNGPVHGTDVTFINYVPFVLVGFLIFLSVLSAQTKCYKISFIVFTSSSHPSIYLVKFHYRLSLRLVVCDQTLLQTFCKLEHMFHSIVQGYSTLVLKIYHPADLNSSFKETHLINIIMGHFPGQGLEFNRDSMKTLHSKCCLVQLISIWETTPR